MGVWLSARHDQRGRTRERGEGLWGLKGTKHKLKSANEAGRGAADSDRPLLLITHWQVDSHHVLQQP